MGVSHGVDLLVTSPLTRALQTASMGFGERMPSTVVSALCAERLYLSADVGSPIKDLELQFPAFDFSDLRESPRWWFEPDPRQAQTHNEWRPSGKYCCPGEPKEVFEARLGRLRDWLVSRPEKRIAVVCHWGVIHGITGVSTENCGTVRLTLKQLLASKISAVH